MSLGKSKARRSGYLAVLGFAFLGMNSYAQSSLNNAPGTILNPNGWTAAASLNSSDASNALDGNTLTGWSTGKRQTSGQWFVVDMKQVRTIHGIVLHAGEGSKDFPRKFHIQVSHDGSLWEYARVVSYDNTTIGVWKLTFPEQNARFVRLMQTAAFEDLSKWQLFGDNVLWSLKEFQVLGDGSNLPPRLRVNYRGKDQQVRVNKTVMLGVKAGENITFKLAVEDPDSKEVRASSKSLPRKASFNSGTGVFSWTPAVNATGYHYITFTATDNSAEEKVTVRVKVSPNGATLAKMNRLEVEEGEPIAFRIPAVGATTFTADKLPKGAYVNSKTGVFYWTPGVSQAGNYTIGLKAGGAAGSLQIKVKDVAGKHPVVKRIFTSQDLTHKLAKQRDLSFGSLSKDRKGTLISIDPASKYHALNGFGNSFDASSIYNVTHMSPGRQQELMRKLFDPVEGAGWNFMRISFGTSDFASDDFYTYQDEPARPFSIEKDIERGIVDIIRQSMEINPDMKILASTWSPPAWMKDNNSLFYGGHVKAEHYEALAQYYVQAIQAYQAEGIPIHAMTLQNEPDVLTPYPSTIFTKEEQKAFLDVLSQAFKKNKLSTEIWIMDTNFPGVVTFVYPVFNDEKARSQAQGVGFHDYSGDPSTMSEVKRAFPDKTMHVTERSTYKVAGSNRLIQYLRNGAETYNAWLFFLDELGEPAVGPLNGSDPPQVVRAPHNKMDEWFLTLDYYLYTQVSRYVQMGARLIESDYGSPATVTNVAFENPDGSIVAFVVNQTDTPQEFAITSPDGTFSDKLPAATVGTYIWAQENKAYGQPIAITKATASHNPEKAHLALDDNLWTSWSTGVAQAANQSQWFQVDLGESKAFNRISFNAGNTVEYPRGIKVQVSPNGSDWKSVGGDNLRGVTNNISVHLPLQNARYIKVTLTDFAMMGPYVPPLPWSIGEFKVYTSAENEAAML